ncbi:MAG: hypothetical protein ACM3UV_08140 [Nocardioidaceae bacterium]
MADTARVLVVANQTAESDELLSALRARAQEGPACFTLLVPATPHGVAWAADMFAGKAEAEHGLHSLVERLRREGLELTGAKVGDPDALAAVQDEANSESYDELIVSTLPHHLSKWLRLDLPRKARHSTGLPVRHIVASRPKARAHS